MRIDVCDGCATPIRGAAPAFTVEIRQDTAAPSHAGKQYQACSGCAERVRSMFRIDFMRYATEIQSKVEAAFASLRTDDE